MENCEHGKPRNKYCHDCMKTGNEDRSSFEDILHHAETLAKRREMLCKKSPLCPDCDTDQVQLIEWIEGKVAEWKCRHCKTCFKFERS